MYTLKKQFVDLSTCRLIRKSSIETAKCFGVSLIHFVYAIFVMLSCYRVTVLKWYVISATRYYSSGAYLYVNYRLSEIKWLLFKASQ